MAEPAILSLLPLGTTPKYLNLAPDDEASYTDVRKDFADVRLISSENETFLCSKLFLVSMSQLLYELIQDVLSLDDSSMLVVHTNLSSEELKIVTEFIMFGYLPLSVKNSTSHQDGSIERAPPDQKALDLLKCFGIDATSFNFHFITPKPQEERLVHPTSNDDFFWLQKEPFLEDLKYKNEARSGQVLQVDDSINNSDIINGNDFLVPDISYYGPENMFPTRRKLYPDAQLKEEYDDFDYDEQDIEGVGEEDDPTYEVNLPKRKRKLGRKAQKSVHGNKKAHLESGEHRKRKKRVGHFYNQFVAEAERHGLSHSSFAAYLGYRACIIDDPSTASSYKRLHEGVNSETGSGISSNEQINDNTLLSAQNGKPIPRSPFLDFTYEQKASSVGTFYDNFLKEAGDQGISASSLAAYCGARSTYRTDRATAAVFRKLHDGEEVKDKSSFKLWSFIGKEKNQSQMTPAYSPLDNKELQCTACGKSLKGKVALRAHMKKLHPDYNNTCLTCNQGHFSNWQEHVDHANQFHDGIIRRKCNVCEAMFESAEELNSHKSSQHSGKAGLVTCTECGKQLMPDTMKGHMITEHGTEPCSCPKCGKQFKHPLALDQHFKRAHEECQCDECGRVSFRNLNVF